MASEHPMQPVVEETDGGVHRFKQNAIVCYLLSAGPFDMNQLALMPFSREDREQFAQLIGYSVCGFGDLSYVRDEAYELATKASEALTNKKAMNDCKTKDERMEEVKELRVGLHLQVVAAESYRKHCGERAVECAKGDLLGEALEALGDLVSAENSAVPWEPTARIAVAMETAQAVLAKAKEKT